MTVRYSTKAGDMVDAICHAYYGRTADVVEAVLEANPFLADYPETLPAGLTIILPDIAEAPTQQLTRLWD